MNFTPLLIITILLFVSIKCSSSEDDTLDGRVVKEIVKRRGDVEIALILHQCDIYNNNHTNSRQFLKQSLINSALWAVERANFLNLSSSDDYGITVYETCSEFDDFNTIFDLFKRKKPVVGLISDCRFPAKIKRFCELLQIRTASISIFYRPLVKATLELIDALKWGQVVVAAPDGEIVEEFFRISNEKTICIQDFYIYKNNDDLPAKISRFVIFGYRPQIENFLDRNYKNQEDLIVVPLDGSIITNDLPKNSYVVLAPQSRLNPEKKAIFAPSPILFQVANPILSYIQSQNRNESYLTELSLFEIIDLLKIEPLASNFHYNIYRGDNGSQQHSKIASYSIFNETINLLETVNLSNESGNNSDLDTDFKTCKNFDKIASYSTNRGEIRIRAESWVFAFLSISFLGLLFCLAILIFLVICICRRDILEGNPSMTLLLLLSIMLMYLSVLPLCLEGKNESLCLIRSLSITLSYCASFSLILSRSILLATASKEIGFMSHIAGPVQSFLGLFIFGVQAALNLQIIGRCGEIYDNFSFVYLLSYNAMLLMLLMCLSPLIYKCERNYREGKYFTLAACLMTCVWGVWVPTFAILDRSWKDPILCFGLVSTASILIGAVFVPRTYLMTLAAARDKIASTLPSLATASSAMDIYRTGTHQQPVYDCVNVATVNAMSIVRAGMTNSDFNNHHQQPDLYLDEEYEARCDSPSSSDKVTRF